MRGWNKATLSGNQKIIYLSMNKFQRLQCIISSSMTMFCYKLFYKRQLKIGKGVSFRKHFSINIGKTGYIEIGKGCFFNQYCSLNAHTHIKIGENCLFGENVKIYDHNHSYKDSSHLIKNQEFTTEPIFIGNNCWISSNCVILKGVTIGDNCVIGAGCIIYKDVPENSVIINKQNLTAL